ncbi:MAG: hypothetical protein ACFE9S_06245 [Candidatus Hermodarchaeota archaeon]
MGSFFEYSAKAFVSKTPAIFIPHWQMNTAMRGVSSSFSAILTVSSLVSTIAYYLSFFPWFFPPNYLF